MCTVTKDQFQLIQEIGALMPGLPLNAISLVYDRIILAYDNDITAAIKGIRRGDVTIFVPGKTKTHSGIG